MNFYRGSISKISIFKNGWAFACKLCIALFILLFTTIHTWAQTNGDYRTNAAGTWNWNTSANWQYYNAGAWGAATNYPGQAAGAGTVTIRNNTNVSLNVSPANAIGNLTFATGTTAATSVNINGYTLAVTGAITLNDPGNGTGDQTLSVGSGTLSCASVTMANTGGDTEDLLIDITTGTLNVSGNFTTSGAANENAFNITSSGTLNIGGNFTGVGTVNCTPSGTVTYYGTNQTMKNGNFYNLNVTGTANLGGITLTVTGTTTVTGTLTCTSGTGTKTMGNIVINGGTWTSNANETFATTALTLNNATINGTGTGRFNVSSTMTVPSGTTTTVNNGSLYVTGNTTIDGSIIYASNTGTKDFTGNVTVSSTGSWTCSANEGFTFRGNLQNDGTFSTGGTATHTFAGANKTLSGTSGITIPTMNITGSYTNQTTVTIANQLNGTGGTLTQFDNSTLNIADAGGFGLTNLVANANGNTVNYYAAANQTVRTGGTTTAYYNMILSGTGTKTLTGLTTVNGNLTTSTTGTLTATTAAGLTIGGNLNIGANTTFTVGGFDFTVNGSTSVSGTHPHTIVTGTKTYVGNVTINNGGTWTNAGNSAFTFQGSLANNGTLTAGTDVYTFTGSAQTLSGTNNLTIPRTTINGSYTNQTTLTVGTALSGTGSLTQADNMTLNIGGTSGISTLNATASGNTVNYNGAGQTVKNTNYHHLTLSGNGIVTMPASPITVGGNFTTSGTNTANVGASINFDGNVTLGSGTTFNAGAFTHSLSGDWNNNGATINPSTGTFTFNGGSSQTIGGTTNTTFNCFTVDNAAGVLLDKAVNAACATLTNGLVTTTSTNLLTVTGTTPTSITGGSSSSYVNGPLAWNLPVATGVTYSFPIGKSGYNPFELVNLTTPGASTFTAEVFDANCGGTPGVGMSSLNTNRYWYATGSITSTQVRLTETVLGDEDAIGRSASQTGAYDRVSDDPPSGNTLITSATTLLTTLGYFAIGEKPIITIAATQQGTEGSINGEFTITTSKNFTVTRYINITITGTATNGTDYTTITSPVTFGPGVSSVTVSVPVTNDNSVEPTETVIVTVDAGTGYAVGSPSSATVNITDDDVAGITVSAISGNTSEAGGQATFTIVLTSNPTANVSIGLSSDIIAEGTVSPSLVTFTPLDWNSAQVVTVTGQNDYIQDGNSTYHIVTSLASSTDNDYKNKIVDDVTVINEDNDAAGITVSAISGNTTEAGVQATFTIVLNSEPTFDVTINLSSNNTNEGNAAPSSVTFIPSEWNFPKTITVTGANDYLVDGNVGYQISLDQATSGDPLYSVIDPPNVSVTNIDNDVAGFVIDPLSGLQTSEAGTSATFTIRLSSQPSSDVEVSFVSSNINEGTVSPSSFTFNSSNWNTNQTITLTGVDGPDNDGDQPYSIAVSVSSTSDLNYQSVSSVNVLAINIDDDSPGFTVNPTTLTTNESGTTASFSIGLNTRPQNDVTITVNTYDSTEGSLSPTTLTFTYANWATPQSITVTGVNDDVDDDDVSYSITFNNSSSLDNDYNNKPLTSISVTNTDNDMAGITVSAISGNTTEIGGTATFTIILTSEPTANVRIDLSSSNSSEGTVSPVYVEFIPSEWNTVKSITVSGVDDYIQDANKTYSITTSQAISSDPKYSVIDPNNVTVINTDDDVAGFDVDRTSGLVTTEASGTDYFQIKLTSEPTANIIVQFASSNSTEGTVQAPTTKTFTPANWNTYQNVTIVGQDDFVDDESVAYSISGTVTPGADVIYNAKVPPTVSVSNTDNDVAGINISPSGTITTTEASGLSHTAIFNIRLTSKPLANVVIGIESQNTGEGTVSYSTITFTPTDWNTDQPITITGVDEFIDDGNANFNVRVYVQSTTDVKYTALSDVFVPVSNTDNDVAGITVSPTSGLSTNESGTTTSFSVVLTSQPTSDVTIGIYSLNINEGTVSTSSLLFTPGIWNIAQQVTIIGVDDQVIDGPTGYTIQTDNALSSDPNYSGRVIPDVTVTNTDNDVAAIIVDPTSGLITYEDGSPTATFTIKLASIPTVDVTIGLSSSNLLEGTVSPSSLVITPANWNADNIVTITGVDDLVDDDDEEYTIYTASSFSEDSHYNGLNPSDVTITNVDNDVAGVTITYTPDPVSGRLITSESGTTAKFSIVLDTKPTANVTVTFTRSNPNEGTLSSNSVTFNTSNWSTPVEITITGKVDNTIDGDQDYAITSSVTSTDTKYSGISVDDVPVTNLDIDIPGITVSPNSGLTTTEAGGTATFTVVLNTKPSNDVIVTISSSVLSEGTVAPLTLTFAKSGTDIWSTPKTVTISGVNDALVDGDVPYSIQFDVTSGDANYDNLPVSDVSVTNTDLTPTITLGSNPTNCAGVISANLIYSATTLGPDQYSIDFDVTAETAGFIDVTNATLPSSPIVITVPGSAPAGTYNGTLTVRNSSYGTCISPEYSIQIIINEVNGGTIADDQTLCSGGNPAAFTSSTDGSGSGVITYRWESSTANCSSGFSPIGGETGTTYDPPSGIAQTTHYRRVTISTLNGVVCEANSNCLTVTVNSISVAIFIEDGDNECPELDPLKGFNPENGVNYNTGATEVVFRVSRQNSTAATWEFDYELQDATVYATSPEDQTGTISSIAANNYVLHFYITNDPGNPIDVKLVVTEVSDSDECSDPTDREEIINVNAMPAVGPFE